MNKNGFPAGKLPAKILKEQLGLMEAEGGRILIGPRYGEDAAAVRMGDKALVFACDPVTLAAVHPGRYAVQVNANDIAVMGARPLWFMAAILLPEGSCDRPVVESVFSDIRSACKEIGVALCGGHTEITPGIDRPIIAGFMAGETSGGALIDKKNIRPGDEIILAGGIAIEGTAIIAIEHPDCLSGLDPDLIRKSRDLLSEPGISIVREALLAAQAGKVHGMHDPTEGGLATALHELAEAAGVGMEIDADKIRVLPETDAISSRLGIDPLGLLASAALLVVSDGANTKRILDAYGDAGVTASVIGVITGKEEGLSMKRRGESAPLPFFERDELTKLIRPAGLDRAN